jgi:hypothetical protein
MEKLEHQVVQKFHEWRQIHGHLVMFILALCITFAITFADVNISFAGNGSWSSLLCKVYRNQSYQNKFIRALHDSIENDPLDIQDRFAPLIITHDGRLLCKSSFKEISFHRGVGHFADKIRSGMNPQLLKSFLSKYNFNGNLPILLMAGDAIGCFITSHADNHTLPRLTWSSPSHINRGNKEWCNDVAVPSYEVWKEFGSKNKTSWENKLYPWSKKIPKAVWRGSTTYDVPEQSWFEPV